MRVAGAVRCTDIHCRMVSDPKMNSDKLKQMQNQVRIGGKGTVRRKKKVVHRTATTDDKKLQSSLKKLSGRFYSK